MALNINGTTGISGVDGSVSAPALTGTDSNTGITFPAADTIKFSTGGVERMQITNSGISGTGISDGGLSMVDMYFLKQNVAVGNDTEADLDSYFDRMTVYPNSAFTGIGTGMTKSGAIFSFPSTGHYEIDFHAQFSCQGYDSARYTHADIVYTVDDSNYNVLNRSRGQSIEYPTNLGNRFSFNITTAIFDVTNISTHKIKLRVQHDQPYLIFGSTTEVTTYCIFKKIADT
tara:strand:- start:252 stop:941 length:690 start_codon:yes stop_codon:yes gene_type:complete